METHQSLERILSRGDRYQWELTHKGAGHKARGSRESEEVVILLRDHVQTQAMVMGQDMEARYMWGEILGHIYKSHLNSNILLSTQCPTICETL